MYLPKISYKKGLSFVSGCSMLLEINYRTVCTQDLTCLNRDLSKVIMIDCDGKAAEDGNRNTVLLKKWEGDPTDRTLLDLIPLLQSEFLHHRKTILDLCNFILFLTG